MARHIKRNLALLSLMVEVLFCKQGVRVRFLQGAPSYCGVGESSRPRQSHKLEIGGANPPPATKSSPCVTHFE